jgi:uncharacterized membrane protein
MTDDRQLELAVGRVLRVGVTASSVCLGIGLVMTLVGGGNGFAHLLLRIGLIALLATPASRVVVSIVDYVLERDWVFVGLTTIVLLELAGSVVAAIYGRKL